MQQSLFLLTMVIAMGQVRGQCPAECTCGWSVTCKSASSFSSIAPFIPSSASTLEFHGSSRSQLEEADFAQISSSQISELSITNGQLQEIGNNAFLKLPYLDKLDLSDNQIYSISNSAFFGLSRLKTLNLARNKLQYLSSSQDMFRPLTMLFSLDLGGNLISELPNGVFSSQSSLQNLRLNGNRLGNLRGGSFQGAQNLRVLEASSCNIRSFENDIFMKFSMIDTLDLSNNGLLSVPGKGNFHLLRNLRNFTLSGNKITVLTDGQFQGLSLDSLDLSRNTINIINQGAFNFMGTVRYLDLSYNMIREVPDSLFQPISSKLYSLKLNNNRDLTSLSPNIFSGMQAMQEVNLSSCALRSIPPDLLQSAFTLTQIDISSNQLSFLPFGFVNRASFMQNVRLNNNPWNCDCAIKPLRNWLQEPRSTNIIHCMDRMALPMYASCHQKCSQPSHLMYKDISLLSDTDLGTCETLGESSAAPVEIIAGAVVGAIIVILLVIICIFCVYRKHKRGEPLLCGDRDSGSSEKKYKKRESKKPKEDEYFREKKLKRSIDPDIGSLNESDKSFVVRNYFHSMDPDPDAITQGTQSMTRKGSLDSLSQSGYEYGSRHGSRHSSQYSLNDGYKIESAV